MNHKKPLNVVITGADSATGLGTARALRGVDAEIIGLFKNEKSRYCRSNIWDRLVAVDDGGVECYYNSLIEIGKSIKRKAILFTIQDNVVQLVSNMRDPLYEFYDFVFPEKETVDMLMEKTKFHNWATENNFPVPESHIANSIGELDNILENIRYPVIVKPLYRTADWDKISPVHKVFKLDNKNDFKTISFNLFDVTPKLIVQQWIPGDDNCVLFCLTYYNRHGNELGYYTGGKILQYPIGTGSTAISIGTEDPFLHDITTKLFKKAEFKGLGSIEVKKDIRDNSYYITEPTVGRNDLQSNTALAGGVNLTKIAYYDALGQESPENIMKKKSSVWIEEYGTLQSALYMVRNKNPYILEIIKSINKNILFCHFSLIDPNPFFMLLKEIISSMKRKIFKVCK